MRSHHISIKTADIFEAIAFYEALGFTVESRFTSGITLACWMIGANTRLELMQVPEPQPTANGFEAESYVGYYHLSFEVDNLELCLQELVAKLGKLKLLLTPRTQEIGDRTYRVAFIADTDGLPIELIQN
ncbi:lactoylglutathione lyase-like lyase [Synechococcus sp. PCC 7502]|uniref:VOC family protein n=1 Tax=Synechococcus sp. PCC 7502 TaxID=1173263 RepID=UPI00029FEF25|nr:VOC family protein [Synechococcus sp. PCC 7502]AFY73621.1 lactoylglutathione lyase-like lyase [Synechococcus sp. PCC 7502]